MVEFTKLIQAQFDKMCASGKLFRSTLTGDQVWNLYINGFESEHNPVFRDPNSTVHNCNVCKNFIRRYGNIVSIDDNYNLVCMFDVSAPKEFDSVAKKLTDALTSAGISEVFYETFNELNSLPYESCKASNSVFKLGTDKNFKRYTKEEAEKFGVVKPDEIRTFNHLWLSLPTKFVSKSSDSIEKIMAQYRDAKNVFERAMQEIPLDTLNLVKDLINQESLLDGKTHLYKIEQIIPFKQAYDNLPSNKRSNYCWVASYGLPFAKFKNELIGVLCTELAEGKELNAACQAWNKRVDPANYMKAIAPITSKQREEAKKFVEENGYIDSFNRRFATIDDIKVSEIKHINVGDVSIKTVSIFDNIKTASTRHKRSEFNGVEEISIEKFMQHVLPSCTSVEAFLGNNFEGNMVSLTTSNVKDSKPIFKWDNNYSWTFNGNLAGKSMIKESVGAKGGNIDGPLRFSINWGEGENIADNSDLDAWAQEPNGTAIGYSAGFRKDRCDKRTSLSGQLDVDIIDPSTYQHKNIVENIAWSDLSKMKNGEYKFWVNQFSARNSKGFKAEIEFNGEIYSYNYNQPVRGNVYVATVTLNSGVFTIKHLLPESESSKELYGLQTNEFHKVNLVCLSPNHWDTNNVGNKHYFFMLNDCKSPFDIRSFHNENLIPELLEHRKVLEVLGASNMIPSTDKQLSGLGFNATVRDELIVRLQGSFKRVVKIKF